MQLFNETLFLAKAAYTIALVKKRIKRAKTSSSIYPNSRSLGRKTKVNRPFLFWLYIYSAMFVTPPTLLFERGGTDLSTPSS